MKKVLTSKLFQLVLLMGLAVALFSCEPVMCEECYTITDSSGSETIHENRLTINCENFADKVFF